MENRGEDHLTETVKELLKPKRITPSNIAYHIRRAKRLGLYWRVLAPLERALLEASIRVRVEEYRNQKLKALIAGLIARIELYTNKGRILLLGLGRALSRAPMSLLSSLDRLVEWAKSKLNYILYLGRSLLVVEYFFAPLRGLWG